MPILLAVTRRELATILAALRYHQAENLQASARIADDAIGNIATGQGRHRSLTSAQIDALCQRLNTSRSAGIRKRRP